MRTQHDSSPANSRRRFISQLTGLSGAATALGPSNVARAEVSRPSRVFDVRNLGAAGDGTTMDTKALQKAIDVCAGAGGGTVSLPAGHYLTGTLFLKSRVRLHLEAGATLLGSRNLDDYPKTIPDVRSYTDNYTERSLIYGENLEQVSLEGRGVIDGQGAAFRGPSKVRPYLLRLVTCRDVRVRDLTLRDSPMWVQHYLACDEVLLDGLTVRSKCNDHNDGLDIDGCQRVRVANCDIHSGDDALVLKSTLHRPCKQVVITNCVLSSDGNAFKLGAESNGGFENIVLSNCAIYDTRLAGLALEVVDGGVLDHINISNVAMRNVRGPLFIRLGNRGRPFQADMPRPAIGRLRNILISDVQAMGADTTGCSITGLSEQPAANLTLNNIRISLAGGGTEADAQRTVPEHEEKNPEYNMFGVLPAYGLYCRHVRGLRLNNVQVEALEPDARPSLVCEDVADLELFRWSATAAAKTGPILRCQNVRQAWIHGCLSPQGAEAFLRLEGEASEQIKLSANELSGARKAVVFGDGASRNAVKVKDR